MHISKRLGSKVAEEVMSYIFIIVGALLASFSVVCILLPNDYKQADGY